MKADFSGLPCLLLYHSMLHVTFLLSFFCVSDQFTLESDIGRIWKIMWTAKHLSTNVCSLKVVSHSPLLWWWRWSGCCCWRLWWWWGWWWWWTKPYLSCLWMYPTAVSHAGGTVRMQQFETSQSHTPPPTPPHPTQARLPGYLHAAAAFHFIHYPPLWPEARGLLGRCPRIPLFTRSATVRKRAIERREGKRGRSPICLCMLEIGGRVGVGWGGYLAPIREAFSNDDKER